MGILLVYFAGSALQSLDFSSCPAVLPKDVLKWEAPRRLAQLRGDLHDRVKYSMELTEYKALFEEAPFAHAGGTWAFCDGGGELLLLILAGMQWIGVEPL